MHVVWLRPQISSTVCSVPPEDLLIEYCQYVRCLKYERNGSYTVVSYFGLQCRSLLAAACWGTLQPLENRRSSIFAAKPRASQHVDVTHGTVFSCGKAEVPLSYISSDEQRNGRLGTVCRVNLSTRSIRITRLRWRSRRKVMDRRGIATRTSLNFKHCLLSKARFQFRFHSVNSRSCVGWRHFGSCPTGPSLQCKRWNVFDVKLLVLWTFRILKWSGMCWICLAVSVTLMYCAQTTELISCDFHDIVAQPF